MIGTLINAAAIILGSSIGLLVHSRMPKNITKIVFHAIGIFTIFLGVNMAMKTSSFLIMIFSIVIGSIIGELIDIDRHINRFGEKIKKKMFFLEIAL